MFHVRKPQPKRVVTSRNWTVQPSATDIEATLCGAPCTDRDVTLRQARQKNMREWMQRDDACSACREAV